MWLIPIFLVCSLFLTGTQQISSISTQISINYFIASGTFDVSLGKMTINPTTAMTKSYRTYFYASNFAQTIYNISNVYYTTAEIRAQTARETYPTDNKIYFVWYEINVANITSTQLTTAISGYF